MDNEPNFLNLTDWPDPDKKHPISNLSKLEGDEPAQKPLGEQEGGELEKAA